MKFLVKGEVEIIAQPDSEPRLVFSLVLPGNMIVEDVNMLVLPIDKKVTASIQPVDAQGNPAAVDGIPQWSASSPFLTVTPSADGLSAEVVPSGTLATGQVNVSADADLGTGVSTINGVLDVQTVAGQAVGFEISTTAPVPIN